MILSWLASPPSPAYTATLTTLTSYFSLSLFTTTQQSTTISNNIPVQDSDIDDWLQVNCTG